MKSEISRVKKRLEEHRADGFAQFYETGFEAEARYGCCGQCTVFPFVKILGVDEGLFKYASGFCAGEGQMGQYPCGAFNGGVLVLASFFGRDVASLSGDIEIGKNYFRNTCRLVRVFEQRFRDVFDGVLCREVQHSVFGRSFAMRDPEDYALFEKMGGHVDKCTNVVGTSARIVAQILDEELGRD